MGTTVTTVDLAKFTTDDQRFRFAFISTDSGTAYTETQLVVSTDVSANTLVTQAAFAAEPTNADLFLVLSPDEWLTALNDYVQSLYYIDWAKITLTAGTHEYDLTATADWLTNKEQIISLRYRNTATSLDPIEASVPSVFIREDEDVLTANLHVFPNDVSNTALWVEARHYNTAEITAWATGVKAQDKLVVAGVKHAALKLIYNKLGPQAKRNYGQAMVLAERDMLTQEHRFQNHTTHKDWQSEEDLQMGNVDGQISWGW